MENPSIDNGQKIKKTAMKNLRAQRRDLISAAILKMKIQTKEIKAIKEFLKDTAATIPEISAGVDMQTDTTLWYIATLKKYGQIVEVQKEGAFFKYALNELEKTTETAEV